MKRLLVLLLVISLLCLVGCDQTNWPKSTLFKDLPKPPGTLDSIVTDTDQHVEFVMKDVSEEQFIKYCEKVEKDGFSEDYKYWTGFMFGKKRTTAANLFYSINSSELRIILAEAAE